MFLERFSEIIDRSRIGASVAKRRELIKRTDPRRIYPENIRSFFHIPRRLAIWLCELAVLEGLFEKRIGFLCPNEDCHRMLVDRDREDLSENELTCEQCEALERDRHVFPPVDCRKIVFYRLAPKGSADGP
jgi:hypothetical protein